MQTVLEFSSNHQPVFTVTDIRPGEVHVAGLVGSRVVQGWVADADLRLVTSPATTESASAKSDNPPAADDRFAARDVWNRARRKAAKSPRLEAMLREADNAVMMSNAYGAATAPQIWDYRKDDYVTVITEGRREHMQAQEQSLRSMFNDSYEMALNREAWKLLTSEERLLIARSDLIPAAELEWLLQLVPLSTE